ncbi:MAG: phosphoglucomutase/phosphomannomutase family protein [Acidobacteria bacterium]|nr:MAG: phosphoglucomutase/phosphomannomutase family protein [Acidobacteriota bacterium]REK02088.1 MAG: phosphoglucomutase/phosphomannomutase family protein [Acidobacteriota bacterium]REK15046.1 MAG: phosphoglucomutase/phosphomannomutase family protein [Acidobacteriota bacterium]REK45760.1 MAG: phosphoglucomutase/phosphomannomutase family protein [Acidobacteriota bacterium]
MKIRFGTSGWRAIIADEFTFGNVRRITESICRYLKESHPAARRLIVGNDSRFMGEKFADVAAEIAADKGYKVFVCDGETPTPAISHAIRHTGAAGGINFTASHNPPEYQGIKFSTSDGAPALPEVTGRIEKLIEARASLDDAAGGESSAFDPKPDYLEDLTSKIRFGEISSAKPRLAYDPLWGTGRGYLDTLLKENGAVVQTLHDWRDVTFGGLSPEPGDKQLVELKRLVIENELDLGLATDGDGDRFGVIDSNGELITPNQLIALLADYLSESRGWNEGIARSVATSHLVDRVADARGLKLYETPVGFKFIGELINKDEIILGGEESAGLSIKGHYPEKDGLLACLLAVEAVASRGASLTEQLNELTQRVGTLFSERIGVRLTPEIAKSLPEILSREPDEIGGRKIESLNRTDGVKFLFGNGSWMLMRPSGTEPLVRIYAESEDKNDLEVLLEQGRRYLLG